MFVQAFAGLDATEAFLSYHRKPFPHASQTDNLLRAVALPKKSSLGSKDTDYSIYFIDILMFNMLYCMIETEKDYL